MKVYFDGGAAPSNPGPMHVGLAIVDGEKFFQKLDHGTNNLAEWTALLWGMEMAKELGAEQVEMIGDSQLIVQQALGLWKINTAEFRPFKAEFDRLRGEFKKVSVKFVKREHNLAGHHIEKMLKSR